MVALVQITQTKPRSKETISTYGVAIRHVCIEFTLPSEHTGTVAEPTTLGSVRLGGHEDEGENYFPTLSNVSPAPKTLVKCDYEQVQC